MVDTENAARIRGTSLAESACMRKLVCLSLLAMAACASPSESSSIPSPGSRGTTHIDVLDGAIADASFDYVIAMADLVDPTGLECDAIVLAPNLLMTARHCVANVDETKIVQCADAGVVAAQPALNGDFDAKSFGFYADGALVHAFPVHAQSIIDDGRSDLCGSDIAFIVLDGNLDGVPVATLAPASEAAKVGDTISVVGWGTTSAGTSLDSKDLLVRDGLSVLALGPTVVQGPSKKEGILAGEIAASIGFCNGDSGGPALDAKGHVVGIVSRAVHSCDTGPDIYTSPQAHFDLAAQAFAAAGVPFAPNGASGTDDAGAVSTTSDASSSSSSGCSANGRNRTGGEAWLVLASVLAILGRRRRHLSI